MITEAIKALVEKADLAPAEMEAVMEEIMTGAATPAQIGAFLVALRLKGETVAEITAGALVMRKHATHIDCGAEGVLDTCGTGGDRAHTFNISTIAALLACGAGAVVAKHGNRAVSSSCGSADLLAELGVNIEAPVEVVEKCLGEVGIGFLFAPLLHGAMKYALSPRREIGIRTIFNILGPLTNPARARHQLLGVYDAGLSEPLAQVLGNLGSKHALVVHGMDGLDEVTITGPTQVSELKNGSVETYTLDCEDFGIKKTGIKNLKGGDPKYNARLCRDILKGEEGPARDIVLLNAGCGLYAADIASSIKEGIARAKDSLDSGKALRKLEELKRVSNA